MSDQFHNYDDYEEVNEETEKFTKSIHLHNQFKRSVGFADEFLRRKLRKQKFIRIISIISLIIIIPVVGYFSYKFFKNVKSDTTTQTTQVMIEPTANQESEEINSPIITADKALDIIVCETMEAPDASKASEALIKEFGDKFNANIYSSSGIKSISVSANLKTELYTALCNNTAAVAPEALSALLKQMIYSPKDANLPSNLVLLNNLTESTDYTRKTGNMIMGLEELSAINQKYFDLILLSSSNVLNQTTNQLFSTSKITISKNKLKY